MHASERWKRREIGAYARKTETERERESERETGTHICMEKLQVRHWHARETLACTSCK